MVGRSALFLPFTVISATATMAQDESTSADVSGESFVRAFIGNCGQNPGNFDLVVGIAEGIEAQEIPDEMRAMMAPQDPSAEFKGYFVQTGEGAPYMLGVSRSMSDGQMMVSCVVANPNIDTSSVVSAIESIISPGALEFDETQMGQRMRIWLTEDSAAGSYMALTDGEPMGYEGATLAMVAPGIE